MDAIPHIDRGPERRLSSVQPSQTVQSVADLLDHLPMSPASTVLIERRIQQRRREDTESILTTADAQWYMLGTFILLTAMLFAIGMWAGHRETLKKSIQAIAHPQQAIYSWAGYHREG